jgi:hypothetical protein
MTTLFKCLICDKEFLNKSNLTKHNNKVKPCKSLNTQQVIHEPITPQEIKETNELNDLKNEVSFLRQEISEIKQLLLTFINPSIQAVQPIQPIQPVQPIKQDEPIEPVETIQPIKEDEPIKPVETIQPIKQVKKTKSIKPIKQTINDPINCITPYEEDDNIYNKLNGEFKNRSCIIQQMETKILNNENFKNIEKTKFNEKTGEPETQTITVLNDATEFINQFYPKNKKSVKYTDKMNQYIEIYKPVLNKNLKSYVFNNNELFFKIGDNWEYEDKTINTLRQTLDETIKKIILNTTRYEDIDDIQTKYLFDLKGTYGDEETDKAINKQMRNLFIC